MKRTFLTTLAVLGTLLLGGCSIKTAAVPTEQTTPLRIGHMPVAQTLFIAEEKGFFREAGLDVSLQKFSNANLAMEALAHHDIDGTGHVSYSTLSAFENKNPDLFALYEGMSEKKDSGFSMLLVKKNAGIKDPIALKGKKILMRSGLSSKSRADLIIKAIGLTPEEVEYIQVDPSLLIPTFAKDEITAFLDVQPFAANILQQGLAEVLVMSPQTKYILDPYPLAGAALRKDFIAAHPETAKKFAAAITRAQNFLKNNESESRAIFQKYLDLNAAVAATIPLPTFVPVEEIDTAAIAKLADIEINYKILDKKPNYENWFAKK